jgi:ssDNA thymidine ADP-ribosyltransferase, DarT
VRREDLEELHYITPISNVPSICMMGILSHRRAARVRHESVALAEIQDRRAKVTVPAGRRLHEYANLYICGRNPMLYRRRDQHERLCVITVSPDVLDLDGVVVTDANASADYVKFGPGSAGLRIVDRELTFAEYWTHQDPIEYYRRKSKKCAEVLVSDRVDPQYLTGAYVSCDRSLREFDELDVELEATVNPYLFFR